jgi:hypothetical protein
MSDGLRRKYEILPLTLADTSNRHHCSHSDTIVLYLAISIPSLNQSANLIIIASSRYRPRLQG